MANVKISELPAAAALTGSEVIPGVQGVTTVGIPTSALLARSAHTGTQAASTISDFAEAVRDAVAAALVAGSNVTITPNDGADTITISASGGGGGATDLGYTPSPTGGTVTSSTGLDAPVPLADGTNAGLLSPAEKGKLANTSGVNTGDQDLSAYATASALTAGLAGKQPLDADLTAIAALATDPFGRSLLTQPSALSLRDVLGALPSRRATGLQAAAAGDLVKAAANSAAVQAQWAAAAADGEVLLLYSPTPVTYHFTVSGTAPRRRAFGPPTTDPGTYYGLLVHPNVTLRWADAQAQNGVIAHLVGAYDHLGGLFVGWPWGMGGTLDGNTAGQTGVSYGQQSFHDGLAVYDTNGNGSERVWVQGLRLNNFYGHPLQLFGDGADGGFGRGARYVTVRDLDCYNMGEGIQFVSTTHFEMRNVRQMPVQNNLQGDIFEYAACQHGVIDNIAAHPKPGEAAVTSGTTFIDPYGSKDLCFTNVRGDRLNSGIDFGGADTVSGRVCDRVTITGGVLRRMAAFYLKGSTGGRVTVADMTWDGDGEYNGSATVQLDTTTHGHTKLVNVRGNYLATANVQYGAVGTLELVNCDWRNGDPAVQAWNYDPRTVTGTLILDNCRFAGYGWGVTTSWADPIPANGLVIKNGTDFSGCTVPRQALGAALTTWENVQVDAHGMAGDAYPPWRLNDPTDPCPAAGYTKSRGLTNGTAASTLPKGHQNQVLDIYPDGVQTYTHGGGIHLLNGRSLVADSGDHLRLRFDGTNWNEECRSLNRVPATPATVGGLTHFVNFTRAWRERMLWSDIARANLSLKPGDPVFWLQCPYTGALVRTASDVSRPTLQRDATTGRWYVDSDGSAMSFGFDPPVAPLSWPAGMSLFFSARPTAVSGNQALLTCWYGADGQGLYLAGSTLTGQVVPSSGTGAVQATKTGVTAGADQVFELVHDLSTLSVALNGVAGSPAAAAFTANTTNNDRWSTMMLRGDAAAGDAQGSYGAFNFTGRVYGWAIHTTALTAAQRAAVRAEVGE